MSSIITVIILFSITLALIAFVIISFAAPLLGAPFVPTTKRQIDQVMKFANVSSQIQFWDLGCGDGRFVAAAAKLGAHAIGVEINPFLVIFTKLKLKMMGLNNTDIILGNLYHQEFSSANAIFIYLFPDIVQKLETKLLKETKPGTIIISKAFPFPRLKPIKQFEDLYVYKISLEDKQSFR